MWTLAHRKSWQLRRFRVQRLVRLVSIWYHMTRLMASACSLTRLSFWYSRVRDYNGDDTGSLVDRTQVHNANAPTTNHADFDRVLRPRLGRHLKSRWTGGKSRRRGECRSRLDGHQTNKDWTESGHLEQIIMFCFEGTRELYEYYHSIAGTEPEAM